MFYFFLFSFSEQSKIPLSVSSGKMSSDAVTQITTVSPGKATFSSEIFINAKDDRHEVPEPKTQKQSKPPVRFASSSSVQHITPARGTDGEKVRLFEMLMPVFMYNCVTNL